MSEGPSLPEVSVIASGPRKPNTPRAAPFKLRALRAIVWGVLAVLTVAVATIGFLSHDADRIEELSEQEKAQARPLGVIDAIYRAVQLFVLESGALDPPVPWELQVTRWLAPALSGYALLQAFGLAFRDQVQRWKIATLPGGHVVVAGLTDPGFLFAIRYSAARARVVAIEGDPRNPHIEAAREAGVLVLIARPGRMESLRRAGVERAHMLIAIDSDLENIEISVKAETLIRRGVRRRRPLECWVHQENLNTCRALRESEAGIPVQGFAREFFNLSENGAVALVRQLPPFDVMGLTMANESPHVLIVGMGRLGDSLLSESARRWRQTPAWQERRGRLQVTVADPMAADRVEALRRRSPELAESCSIEAITTTRHDPRLVDFPFAFSETGRCVVTSAYVCPSDEVEALPLAVRLQRRCAKAGCKPPIALCYQRGHEVEDLVRGGRVDGAFPNLKVFSLYDQTCKPEVIAQVRRVLRPGSEVPKLPIPELEDWDE